MPDLALGSKFGISILKGNTNIFMTYQVLLRILKKNTVE